MDALQWQAPTDHDRREWQGDSPLALVATDHGVYAFDRTFQYDVPYGNMYATIDETGCIVFTFDGGGPAPYDEWTVFYYAQCQTVQDAQTLGALVYAELVAGTMTEANWQALGFTKDTL